MRKIKEIFIAVHIEQLLTKQEIMALYVNKIFLGYRSYGFGAAAQTYFGKDLADLSLSEIATLAGMPKAPSTMNPIYSLERATKRRNIVLMRMLDEKYITPQEYKQARSEEIVASYHGAEIELDANAEQIDFFSTYLSRVKHNGRAYETYLSSPYTRVVLPKR